MEWWSGSAYSLWSASRLGSPRPIRNRRRHRADSAVRLSLFAAVRRGAFGRMMHVAVGTSMALVLQSAIASTRKRRARESRPVVLPDLGRRDPDRRPDQDRAAALCVHRTSASDLCALHGDGRLPRGLPEGPSDRACATARRDKAGVSDRLPCRVDWHRRRRARELRSCKALA